MFQEIINKIINLYYRDDVARFDKEYAELIAGEQFPDEKEFSRQLDFAKKTFNGQKISTDFFTNHYDETEITGLDNTTD